MQIDITKELEVINAITTNNEFLTDKSLELKEEEELFNAIKNFEQVQKYILEEIKKIGKKGPPKAVWLRPNFAMSKFGRNFANACI